MQQQVSVKVSQAGGSLYLVLTKQLESLKVKAKDRVMVSWDDNEIVIQRVK
jgi:hypothetical protein